MDISENKILVKSLRMGQALENAVFWTWHSYQIYELSSCGYLHQTYTN